FCLSREKDDKKNINSTNKRNHRNYCLRSRNNLYPWNNLPTFAAYKSKTKKNADYGKDFQ
ncbi:MAG: hypothetical protein PUG76_06995, partial [Prevotellaceae bacterium]|nr:hypothetical protein [Prevotellaceae bacterium]